MDMVQILQQTGGLDAMAKQLGIPPAMAQTGAAVLLPAILGGFKKQTQAQPSGLEGLGGLLGGLGGGGLLDKVLAPEPTPVDQGNDVLGQIFGSKDVSRTVAAQGAEQSGLDSGLLKQMLPVLAMLVAGYFAKQAGGAGTQASTQASGGGLGDLIGGLLGGGQQQASGGALDGIGSLLDLDGDGNPLDDIIGMAGKLAR